MVSSNRGNFFAIDRHQWAGVCELGMNVALLYLILARGSDRLNKISSWSSNALQKYTNVARSRAKTARMVLLRSEFVINISNSTNPRYELVRSPGFKEKQDEIWIPNELITRAAGEDTAIERIRQTDDVMILRLLIDLYHQQNLVDDSGIARGCVHERYDRKRIAGSGKYTIWGFTRSDLQCYQDNEILSPHCLQDESLFFERFGTLLDLGLVVMVPYLCESDSPDAEIIHSLAEEFDCDGVSVAAEDAVIRMLPEQYTFETECHDFVVPVLRHIRNVAVIGIAKTRFRPKTSLTAAGKAQHIIRATEYADAYKQMGVE